MTMESFCWALPGKQEHSPSHVLSAPGHATQQQLLHMCKAPQAHSMVITGDLPSPAGMGVSCAVCWEVVAGMVLLHLLHRPSVSSATQGGDVHAHVFICTSVCMCAHEQILWHCSSFSAQMGSGEGRGSFSSSPIHQHGREGVVTCVGCGADMDYINLYFCHSLFPEKKRECKINPEPLCGVSCLKQSLWQSHSLTATL